MESRRDVQHPQLLPEADVDRLIFEVLGGAARQDPYPSYATLLDAAPVHRSTALDMWFVSSYDTAKHVLHDPRFGRGSGSMLGQMGDPAAGQRSGAMRDQARNMLFADPPDHTRLRGLVSRAFTPRRIEGLRSSISALLEPLLDQVADAGEVDLLDAVAFRFPVAVIGELVGVPAADRDQFRTLVRVSTAMIEASPDLASLEAAETAMGTMTSYFADLVAERTAAPQDDLISAMIRVDDDGDRLTTEEIVSTAILLFAAGFETTTNLIGNGTLCLLRNPDQMAELRSHPEQAATAVEEVLRFESPVQLDARRALVDADIDGTPVPAGTSVVTLLGAANRDPAVYPAPDLFQIDRTPNHPLSFGWGIHHCLGANLARLEGQIVFNRLLERFPTIEPAGPDPIWRPSVTLRGLEELRITVRPT